MAFQGDSIFWVEVEKIVPNPFQPRREFDEDKLRELAESIRMYGVLQPLTVTRKEVFDENGAFYTEYELIAGERRLRASRLAGLEQVPVLIRSGEQTEQEKLELAIIENLQREDLNAVDRALAFKQLADIFELSHSEVAKKVGRSREYVSNSIRILALPDHILNTLRRNEISEGHARTLLMLKERPVEQDVVFREILLKKLSVREVERIARKIATDKVRKKEWLNTDAHLIEMERAFTDTLGTRVQISKTDFGGKLTIDYFSESDLEKLLAVIKTKESIWEIPAIGEALTTEANQTVIRTMDEVTTPLQEIVKATPLEMVQDTPVFDEQAVKESMSVPTSVSAHSTEITAVETVVPVMPVAPSETAMETKLPVETMVPREASSVDTEAPVASYTPKEPEDNLPPLVPPSTAIPQVSDSPVSEAVASEVSPVEEVRQVMSEIVSPPIALVPEEPAVPTALTAEPEPEPVANDDDLYSMRNFSL